MIDTGTIQRIAESMHALRPEWNTGSLITLLTKHRTRPARDLAIAAVFVATDPKTKTPALINESPPWVAAGRAVRFDEGNTTSQPPRPSDACPIDGHGSFLAHNCGACRGERLGNPREPEPPDEEQAQINREGRELVRRAVISRGDAEI